MHGNMSVKFVSNFVKCLDSIGGGQQEFQAAWYYYEGWNFNSGNYLFTTDTK